MSETDLDYGFSEDDEHLENSFSSEPEYMVAGCLFPGYCLIPGSHYKQECHTAEMLETYQETFEVEQDDRT